MLMIIGMLTVFVVLVLVINLGNLLIRAVNRFYPGKPLEKPNGSFEGPGSGVGLKKVAAIVTAVDVATKGKAKVIGIKPGKH